MAASPLRGRRHHAGGENERLVDDIARLHGGSGRGIWGGEKQSGAMVRAAWRLTPTVANSPLPLEETAPWRASPPATVLAASHSGGRPLANCCHLPIYRHRPSNSSLLYLSAAHQASVRLRIALVKAWSINALLGDGGAGEKSNKRGRKRVVSMRGTEMAAE